MDPRLTQILDVARQLPEARQRDAADMITTLLEFSDAKLAAQHASFTALFEPEEPTEIIDWGAPAGMLSLRFKPRSPIEPGVGLTEELASALQRLAGAAHDCQDAVRLLLGNMIENESQELDLTPEEMIELKRQIDESKADLDGALGIEWKPGEPLPKRSTSRSNNK